MVWGGERYREGERIICGPGTFRRARSKGNQPGESALSLLAPSVGRGCPEDEKKCHIPALATASRWVTGDIRGARVGDSRRAKGHAGHYGGVLAAATYAG